MKLKFFTPVALSLLWLLMPCALDAGEFNIQLAGSGKSKPLEIHSTVEANYLDLKELASCLPGGSLAWEVPTERITWVLDGVSLTFEDRLAFFTANGSSCQLVACCMVSGGGFLVPVQLAVEYLPRFFPERFSYNKLENRLKDGGSIEVASRKLPQGKGQVAAPVKRGKPGGVVSHLGDYRIRTVVIDPGHGGRDPGALSRRYKKHEKDLVLDISKRVVARLKRKSKLKVVLTRSSDKYIPLGRRGRIANENKAGLFVSIHVNAGKSSRTRGTSTFFLDAAKTNEDRATAMLENASQKYEIEQVDTERLDEVNLILQDLAQNEFLRESYELSTYIHRELMKRCKLPAWGRGVRQANFAVLRGAFMPAALVETAFISNPTDEKSLNTKKFREKAAEAISTGILAYIDHYHKKLVSGR
ncbi:MAG: N-acetylmuramoyl-L-alanine amidase [Gemmatimonadota bacterium]|nr:N-acetylmuramoyl-L-alanine amidase [Gemmatimonadota bacterium]